MFNKLTKLSNRIKNLEKRISDIQNPYLFDNGQDIEYYDGPFCYNMPTETNNKENYKSGKIVLKKYDYVETKDITYINNDYFDYKLYVYRRENKYLIYDEKANNSIWVTEFLIKAKNKKK